VETMKKTLRGIKIVIKDAKYIDNIVINTLRYSLHESATKHGNRDIPALQRAKGITSKKLKNKFGATYYYENASERAQVLSYLKKCMPAYLIGKVTLTKVRSKVSEARFEQKVHTLRAHAA